MLGKEGATSVHRSLAGGEGVAEHSVRIERLGSNSRKDLGPNSDSMTYQLGHARQLI